MLIASSVSLLHTGINQYFGKDARHEAARRDRVNMLATRITNAETAIYNYEQQLGPVIQDCRSVLTLAGEKIDANRQKNPTAGTDNLHYSIAAVSATADPACMTNNLSIDSARSLLASSTTVAATMREAQAEQKSVQEFQDMIAYRIGMGGLLFNLGTFALLRKSGKDKS